MGVSASKGNGVNERIIANVCIPSPGTAPITGGMDTRPVSLICASIIQYCSLKIKGFRKYSLPPRYVEWNAPRHECRGRCPHRPETLRNCPGALNGTEEWSVYVTFSHSIGHGLDPTLGGTMWASSPTRGQGCDSFNRAWRQTGPVREDWGAVHSTGPVWVRKSPRPVGAAGF